MNLIRITKYVDCYIFVYEKRTQISTPIRNTDTLIEFIFIKTDQYESSNIKYSIL